MASRSVGCTAGIEHCGGVKGGAVGGPHPPPPPAAPPSLKALNIFRLISKPRSASEAAI